MTYMLTPNEERIAKEWEKYLRYTVRPLPSTIAYYQHWIASYSAQHTSLLFGGTPEIRTVFQKLKRQLILVDRDVTVIRAMGMLTHAKCPIASNELFVLRNWLEINFFNGKFDLLIGDDAINMVRWQEFDLFLRNAYQLLQQDGLFICHLLVKPDEKWINQNMQDLLNEYKEGRMTSPYDLASRLNFICFDRKQYRMGWQDTIKKLGKEKLDDFKPLLDFVDTFKYCNSRFTCPPQSDFEDKVTRYFEIEELFYPQEYDYCQYEPVYILKRKKIL